MRFLGARFVAFGLLLAPGVTSRGPLVSQGRVIWPDSQAISLTQLLDVVRARSPRLDANTARVAAAVGARRAAGVFPNPVVGLSLENATLPGRARVVGLDREVMTTATVPLEFVYQRGVRVDRAEAELGAARADAFAGRQRIALAATHAYYRTALAQVELETVLDLAGWLDSLVAYNRLRAAEGVAAEADLLRAWLERERVLTEVTMQRVALAQARASLAALYADSSFAVPTVIAPRSPLGVPALELQGRPEIQAARARLVAAGAGVGMARSMFVRDLSAMAGLKWSAGTTTLLAGLSLPLPLVDQNRGDVARAIAERDVATLDLTAVEREARAELSAAIEVAGLLDERSRALSGGYLDQADTARRIALGAYREGAVPLIQVLDAARAWGEARLSFFRALYAQHESVMALLAAEGKDLFTAIPALREKGGR